MIFDPYEIVALICLITLLSGSVGTIVSYLILRMYKDENMADLGDLFKAFVNIVEFAIVIAIAYLIRGAVYASFISAGVETTISVIASWIAFFVTILVYYGKIRAYIRVDL